MIRFTPDQCKRIGELAQRMASVGFDSVTGNYEIQRGDIKIVAKVIDGNVNFTILTGTGRKGNDFRKNGTPRR
jgi:hypothetical protein